MSDPIVVTVPVDDPQPPAPAPVVIVNDAPATEPASDAVVAAAIDNAGDVALLQASIAELQATVETQSAEIANLRFEAEENRTAAEAATAAAAEALEGPQAKPEEDDVPKHEHSFWQPIGHHE